MLNDFQFYIIIPIDILIFNFINNLLNLVQIGQPFRGFITQKIKREILTAHEVSQKSLNK